MSHPIKLTTYLLLHFRHGEEAPRAYVVSLDAMTVDDVTEYMKKNVSKVKYLTGGIIFVDAIPKNPVCRYRIHMYYKTALTLRNSQSGKILRKVLRDRAKEEVEMKSSKL
jgi:4-coumarate--CoA ligase